MNIVVCVKQVPDSAKVHMKRDHTLERTGQASIMNPYDLHAVEEAVALKEAHGGRVYAITMGPLQAESVLRTAISMGADEGILLSDRRFAGSDTLATSYVLASAINKLKADIVLTGKQAIDGDTGQVGPGIAEHLQFTHCTEVRKIHGVDQNSIVVERLLETGILKLKVKIPILLSVVKEINQPRIPGIKSRKKALSADIKRLTSENLPLDPSRVGLKGSPTKVKKIYKPQKTNLTHFISGNDEDQVAGLFRALNEQGLEVKSGGSL